MLRNLFHAMRPVLPWALEPIYVRRRRAELRRRIESGHYDPDPERPVHFNYERASPGRSIPHVWHQTWQTGLITGDAPPSAGEPQVPEAFRDNVADLKALHPTWRHEFWGNARMEPLVREHFPQYWDAFAALPKVILQADVFRYMLLWVHGGVYADLDVLARKPHDALVDDCALLLPAETDETAAMPFVGQHLLGSCPRHEFWLDLLREALDRPTEEVRAYADPLEATGPKLVTRVWRAGRERYRAKIPRMVYLCVPPWLLHPKFEVPNAAYSVHACLGTWR